MHNGISYARANGSRLLRLSKLSEPPEQVVVLDFEQVEYSDLGASVKSVKSSTGGTSNHNSNFTTTNHHQAPDQLAQPKV
jgi:hypothetical protein